jgi:hypothetical protein
MGIAMADRAIVIADRPLLMADRAHRRELGALLEELGMTHIQPASQCLHQLVMGQPSHIPKADDMLMKETFRHLHENAQCWGKHGSIIYNREKFR